MEVWRTEQLGAWRRKGRQTLWPVSSSAEYMYTTLDSAKHNKLILQHTPTHKHTVLKAFFHSPLPISLSSATIAATLSSSLLFSSLLLSSLCMCNPTALPPGAFLLLLLFCIYSGGRMFGTGEKWGPWWL
ncbi:hypothetical protein KC19_11G063400 [Ceratodon purpureus]|uniref:Uncharacterized protein n=1 Tax=Ceratodon purpureus TaxID=3225 RepID=A0A8T0GEL6_CERPU|nr:hypothetical protein KC19_11G063400 [Ceratodon purpureus]